MRRNRLPVLGCLALLLAGCTHYVWVKPQGDPATYPADHYACEQESHQLAPPTFQIYDPFPHRPFATRIVQTDCRDPDKRHCRTVIERYGYPEPPHAVDLNRSARRELYGACMQAKGWVLQPIDGSE